MLFPLLLLSSFSLCCSRDELSDYFRCPTHLHHASFLWGWWILSHLKLETQTYPSFSLLPRSWHFSTREKQLLQQPIGGCKVIRKYSSKTKKDKKELCWTEEKLKLNFKMTWEKEERKLLNWSLITYLVLCMDG